MPRTARDSACYVAAETVAHFLPANAPIPIGRIREPSPTPVAPGDPPRPSAGERLVGPAWLGDLGDRGGPQIPAPGRAPSTSGQSGTPLAGGDATVRIARARACA